MDPLPPNVTQRLGSLRGAALTMLYEPYGRTRVSLFFQQTHAPLNILLDGIREARWPFAYYPSLRVGFRFSTAVREVRFAVSKSFATQDRRQAAHLEVDIEGAATMVFEAESITIGPVPPPAPPARSMLS